MFKSHMKHCFISQSYTLLTCFVFDWVVEASTVCFIDCLAHIPWWWKGVEGSAAHFIDYLTHILWWQRDVNAGSSLASSSTASLLYINGSVTSVTLICITAYAQYSFTFYCFAAQCCSNTAYCWGRFLVEAAPASSRQYHGSCLPKAVKAECYWPRTLSSNLFWNQACLWFLIEATETLSRKPCWGFGARLGSLSGLAQGLLAWSWQGSSAFLCFHLL